jgi:Na+/proline symporter
MVLYVAGAAVSLLVILAKIPGGWEHVVAAAGHARKLQVFDFAFSPTTQFFARKYSFWAGLIGGASLTMASHGTDQLMVQRLLSARTEADSRRALLSSWLIIFFQFSLFLAIGVMLFVYYQDNHLVQPQSLDRIYPEFVWRHLPAGVAGLVTAAILAAAMANLSAALNSLASTTVIDFIAPWFPQSSGVSLKLARGMTVAWGFVLIAIGMLARHWGSVLESGLSIASVTLGLLLGVFLLGVLTKRAGEVSAMIGLVAGLAAILYVSERTSIAWTWWVSIGSTVTFAAGCMAAYCKLDPREVSHDR